ncbi:MAG: aminoacyl-tRNA hydrolase [Planctomycetota bacterium]
MKLIVGLGNPGSEYQNTRHNAGFMVLDRLAEQSASGMSWRGQFQGMAITADIVPGVRTVLLKPTTYMNRSGQAVAEALRFYKLDPSEDVLVVVDDLALPCGHIRARANGGAGGHNGLSSIEQLLGTSGYPRLRIGIDEKGLSNQVDYVLGRFTEDQFDRVRPAIDQATELCRCWVSDGIDTAMNRFNTPSPKKPKKAKSEINQEDSEPAELDAPARANETETQAK